MCISFVIDVDHVTAESIFIPDSFIQIFSHSRKINKISFRLRCNNMSKTDPWPSHIIHTKSSANWHAKLLMYLSLLDFSFFLLHKNKKNLQTNYSAFLKTHLWHDLLSKV